MKISVRTTVLVAIWIFATIIISIIADDFSDNSPFIIAIVAIPLFIFTLISFYFDDRKHKRT